MSSGCIRFDEARLGWISLLRSIYEFESLRVAGPGSYRRDISQCLWTVDDLIRSNADLASSRADLEKLLKYLEENRQLMVIRDGDRTRYITRMAETVRLLGHTYEYWHKGRPMVSATRWLIDEKRFPRKEVTVNGAKQRLMAMVGRDIGTGPTVANLISSIEKVVNATAKSLRPEEWEKVKFSEFQIEATEEIIKAHFCKNHNKKTQILTAGVGSGKTIAFSMGTMIVALEAQLGGTESRKCCLFLYPRTALARDQWTKLKEISRHLRPRLDVHFEHMEFYKSKKMTVADGVDKTYTDSDFPPLVVTTLETLKRRLHRPPFTQTISERLHHVVLDEIHLVEDLTGTQIVHLLNRLKAVCPSDRTVRFTGSSATVACPEKHASTVFGVALSDVRVIEPAHDRMDVVGLVSHVFLRPSEGISTLGCLINASSTLCHNRRDNVGRRILDDPNMIPKTIGFADNLDMIGRWNADLRENERTENDFSLQWARKHPMTNNPSNWEERQRELPYALRFHNPLQQRIGASPGQNDPYEKLGVNVCKDPCQRCRNGERLSFGRASDSDMEALGRFVYRYPSLQADDVERFTIDNPWIFESGGCDLGTLDLCPYLRSGACFWFPNDDFEIEKIPGTNTLHDFKCVARSRIYSSKAKPQVSEDDDISSTAFTAGVNEVYGPIHGLDDEKQKIPIDVVVSSPSLEVGIDLSNVTESIMFKAIRNASAYRQKAGRAGRELGSDTINVTLLSARAMDFHYYRQPRKLVSVQTLDPIPLKRENPIIMKSAAYMSVWDYLALNADLPERIPMSWDKGQDGRGHSLFSKRIGQCLKLLSSERTAVMDHLNTVADGKLTQNEMELAIRRVEEDLSIFLLPVSGVIAGKDFTYLGDLVVNALNMFSGNQRFRGERLENAVMTHLSSLKKDEAVIEIERKRFDPIVLGLASEFETLDRMIRCGWSIGKLGNIITKFESANQSGLITLIQKLKDAEASLKAIEAQGRIEVCFFKEQFAKAFTKRTSGKAYYLSYVIEELPIFDGYIDGERFQRQKNLFTNPYEAEVYMSRLKGHGQSGSPDELPPALVGEAMHSYIPGTWTHRMGGPVKVRIGRLLGAGHHLIASLRDMMDAGSTFTELKTGARGPPFFGPGYIDLYQPRRVSLQHVDKYVMANAIRGTVIDKDEDDQRPHKDNAAYVKVPKSYLAGWTHITASPAEALALADFELDSMKIVAQAGSQPFTPALIKHPLQSRLVSEVRWLPRMDVIEYVFDITRSFSSQDVTGATVTFQDMAKGMNVGFGRLLETEGVRLDLNKDSFQTLVSKLKDELKSNPKWSPSALLAFRALLGRVVLEDGTHMDPFTIRDITTIVLFGLVDEIENTSFTGMVGKLKSYAEDEESLRQTATMHFKTKKRNLANDLAADGGRARTEVDDTVGEEVNNSCTILHKVYNQLLQTVPDLDGFLEEWIAFTLMNTIGIAAYNSIQRLCGTGDDSVGYLPDLDGAASQSYGIYLYDRDEKGNGSCETVRRFFHILYLQRVAQTDKSRLPTEDFLTILEQELLQCPQFHTDMLALELYASQGATSTGVLPELAYVHDSAEEVRHVSESVWAKLGVRGRDDAWKLPLYAAMSDMAANHFNIDRDDLQRATSICWNGCPECVASDQMLMGYLRGRDYVDKAIMDAWFEIGRSQTAEYKCPSSADIVSGSANLDIGSLSVLCIQKHRLHRAVSLPFTIGVELDRTSSAASPKLVIRDNDVQGLKLLQATGGGVGQGVSVGFGRLVCYNLLMTAYLESVGAIPSEKKEVLMVYYDIRDVPFQDIGASERMWESLDYHRRASGNSRRLERLSDILQWLASRGFRITVCVDKERSKEKGVNELLTTLKGHNPSGSSIRLLLKDPQTGGIMHTKGLVTPVGTIDGSANLTFNAIERNDESVNVTNVGTAGYLNIKTRLQDVLVNAEPWEP